MEDLMSTDACTLPTVDRSLRLGEFASLFSSSALDVVRDERGLRVRLAGDPGLRDRVQDLADRESVCCSFFTFVITGRDEDLTLDVSVPAERRWILDALADLAERQSS